MDTTIKTTTHDTPQGAKEALTHALTAAGMTYSAIFVPWSKSRYARPNPKASEYNLNWRVTFSRGSQKLETDFMQGTGHIPESGELKKLRGVCAGQQMIQRACESGRLPLTYEHESRKDIPSPDAADVMYCLLLDAGAIDYATFEDCASEFGYETDSRKAEKMYRECLSTGLQLRAMLGDENMRKMTELARQM